MSFFHRYIDRDRFLAELWLDLAWGEKFGK
jgi:hypothetical protein